MIKEFFEGIAKTIISRPKLVAVLVLVFFCIGLYGVTLLSMETGWKTYMNEDSAGGILQAEYEENFQSDSIIPANCSHHERHTPFTDRFSVGGPGQPSV